MEAAVPIIIIVVPIGSGLFAGFGVVRLTFTTSACPSVSGVLRAACPVARPGPRIEDCRKCS